MFFSVCHRLSNPDPRGAVEQIMLVKSMAARASLPGFKSQPYHLPRRSYPTLSEFLSYLFCISVSSSVTGTSKSACP